MRFLAPGFLHLAWVLLIPLLLYLHRRQAKRFSVSTMLFFRMLAQEHQETAWSRRLKRWLALLFFLAMLMLGILALARPVFWARDADAGGVVIVLDRSASMEAKAEMGKGESRLSEAKRLLKNRIDGLSDGVVVSLVAMDSAAEVLVARSTDHREVIRELEGLQTRPLAVNVETGYRLAQRLVNSESDGLLWWCSDRSPEFFSTVEESLAAKIEVLNMGLSDPVNVGLTGFSARFAPLARNQLEVFFQVRAAQANSRRVTARLEVELEGRLAHLRELELEPGESRNLTLPIEGVHGQVLRARLVAEQDCLGWDDAVVARLPISRPLRIAWYGVDADPFVDLALASLVESGRIEMWKGLPLAYPPPDQPDLWIFENWVPEEWPTDRPVLALNPPADVGPVRVTRLKQSGWTSRTVHVAAADHPVLAGIAEGRLRLKQTAMLSTEGSMEWLWVSGQEPLLIAGENSGQRLVVSAFSPALSEGLALQPEFPLLIGNELLWLADDEEGRRGLNLRRTGEVVEMKSAQQWQYWDGRAFIEDQVDAVGWSELDRIGTWTDELGASGVGLLAAVRETDVPKQSQTSSEIGGESAEEPTVPFAGFNLVEGLVIGLLLLLITESYMFHRWNLL